MLLAVRISSHGCTWEVWRALKKLELLSAIASSNSYASFVRASITRYAHAKHEPILNCKIMFKSSNFPYRSEVSLHISFESD